MYLSLLSSNMFLLSVKQIKNIRNAYWNVQNGVSIVKAQKAALLSAKIKLASDKLVIKVGI